MFDEADGLFSKRTEISSSNDRYANTETGYLLQKFEEYSGVSILTTNFMGNMDEAFRRRFTFMVRFPFPDQATRLQLWKSILPKKALLEEELELEYFAKHFELTGSEIKETLTMAAYLSATEESGISNQSIYAAIQMIYEKYARKIPQTDLRYLNIL